MAKARAICTCKTCGREFEVAAVKRNFREAASWEQWAVANYTECPDCYHKRRTEEAADIASKAAEDGLVPLEGTEKQKVWAEQIRAEKLAKMRTAIEDLQAQLESSDSDSRSKVLMRQDLQVFPLVLDYIAKNMSSSSWWIDKRELSAPYIAQIVFKEHKDTIMKGTNIPESSGQNRS